MPASPATKLTTVYAPLNTLVQRLAQLWQPAARLARGERACVSLRRSQLECLKGNAEWSDLAAMNLPAVLTFSEHGNLRYVLLRELGSDEATLQGTGGTVRLPLAALDPLWTGEYLLLWHRETDESAIGPEVRGAPILWLRQRLAARLGAAAVKVDDATWDEALRKNVQRVQSQLGVRADGIAGPRTLLALASMPGPSLGNRRRASP